MSHNPIIVTRHLSHIYLSGQFQKKALHDINLEIAQGSCVAIVGVNGSGKTTLVQHFNGLLRPTEGTVLVDGIDVSAKGVDLRELRQRVGMLFQLPETQLFGRTVFEDVAFGPRRMHLSRREVRSRVIGALETVGLPHRDYALRSPYYLLAGHPHPFTAAVYLPILRALLYLN